jgi:apolipoprotein D and lipocalin family protein
MYYFRLISLWLTLSLLGCADIPEGIQPVTGLEVDRYIGKWYEIARLDHSFERGLSHVTADYSLHDDGDLRVINRGFNANNNEWRQAEGRAKFVDMADEGRLKVSFFGPFYGGYNIIDLDRQNYSYAMIAGNDRSYLWILSRAPQLDAATQNRLIEKARRLGFPVEALIFVEQSKHTHGG